MTEYYLQIKILHIGCVLLSGSIFAFRGFLMMAGSQLANHPLLKYPSYINDSILLAAGVMLMFITQQYPVAQAWLSVKLLLLLLYIVLGVFALRRGKTRQSRSGFFVAAVAVYLFMLSVARGHHPLGLLAL
ncbi:MAG: SirB2 family protein [Salinisphaeraceae bacterium]|nr:SirB2 family protein [Salinisphaeraceae bacterium]